MVCKELVLTSLSAFYKLPIYIGVFKILNARQSEIHVQFARNQARLICVITSGSCLENSSDFKHCFGVEVEATVEPGHRVKSL